MANPNPQPEITREIFEEKLEQAKRAAENSFQAAREFWQTQLDYEAGQLMLHFDD